MLRLSLAVLVVQIAVCAARMMNVADFGEMTVLEQLELLKDFIEIVQLVCTLIGESQDEG